MITKVRLKLAIQEQCQLFHMDWGYGHELVRVLMFFFFLLLAEHHVCSNQI